MNSHLKTTLRNLLPIVIGFVLNFYTPVNATTDEILCESIVNVKWSKKYGQHETCFMHIATLIDSPGSTFSSASDETVTGLTFYTNKKVFYLPTRLDSTFPSLTHLSGMSCSIRTLSKESFQNLTKLVSLSLTKNEIKTVASDTFQDLVSLEELGLGEYLITSLSIHLSSN